MGHPREGLEIGPPTMFSLPCQHLGTIGSLLQSCSQGLQDNMANGSLPRELGTDCIQPISGLIGLPGGPDCSSQSGLFVLVSATYALEPEHVEEDRENAMLTSSVKNLETGFCVFYQSISMFCCTGFLWTRVGRQTCSHQFSCSHHQKPCCHFGSMLIIILMIIMSACTCTVYQQLKHFNLISLSLIHSCRSISQLLLHCLHYKLIDNPGEVMVKHAVPEPNRFMSVIKILSDSDCCLLCRSYPQFKDKEAITFTTVLSVWNNRANKSTKCSLSHELFVKRFLHFNYSRNKTYYITSWCQHFLWNTYINIISTCFHKDHKCPLTSPMGGFGRSWNT